MTDGVEHGSTTVTRARTTVLGKPRTVCADISVGWADVVPTDSQVKVTAQYPGDACVAIDLSPAQAVEFAEELVAAAGNVDPESVPESDLQGGDGE